MSNEDLENVRKIVISLCVIVAGSYYILSQWIG